MHIVAIDVGLRSLGWAAYDSSLGNVSDAAAWSLGIVDLWKGAKKKEKTDYCLLSKRMLLTMPCFARADVVLIERQMQARMKQVATALRAFLWPRARLVSPIVVKRFFGTSMGQYKLNKSAGVALAREIVPTAIRAQIMEMKAKQETDVADALLMCYWHWFVGVKKEIPVHIRTALRTRGKLY
jgi:hypothetical protein